MGEHMPKSRAPRQDTGFGPKTIARGRELAAMMMLPTIDWPPHLFVDVNKMVSGAKAPTGTLKNGDACTCGCGQAHRQNVPQTFPSQYGHGFNVVYFASDRCKTKWNRQRTGSQANGF